MKKENCDLLCGMLDQCSMCGECGLHNKLIVEASAHCVVESDATKHRGNDGIKIPTSLHEVDNGKILGFGADLAEDHPVHCSATNTTGFDSDLNDTAMLDVIAIRHPFACFPSYPTIV